MAFIWHHFVWFTWYEINSKKILNEEKKPCPTLNPPEFTRYCPMRTKCLIYLFDCWDPLWTEGKDRRNDIYLTFFGWPTMKRWSTEWKTNNIRQIPNDFRGIQFFWFRFYHRNELFVFSITEIQLNDPFRKYYIDLRLQREKKKTFNKGDFVWLTRFKMKASSSAATIPKTNNLRAVIIWTQSNLILASFGCRVHEPGLRIHTYIRT